MTNVVARKAASEWLLILTIVGWGATSLYLQRFPHYSITDFKVVYTLFVFLVIIKGLESSGALQGVAVYLDGGKYLAPKLVAVTAFLSMFVTNDVALLTMVPITLALDMDARTVILETLVANGASALTPFGNPQNIFIYYHYHLHPLMFIRAIAPLAIVSFSLVLLASFGGGGGEHASSLGEKPPPLQSGRALFYLASFLLFIVAVLRLLPLYVGVVPLFYALSLDRASLRVDYALLAVFLGFFGFTDNLMHILHFKLVSPTQVFMYSSIGSQIMSNVPGALLFADFTSNWHALLWGVNVGGFGNLLGSLASLISYRLYKGHTHRQGPFLVEFHLWGYSAFFAGWGLYFCIRLLC